MVAFDNTFLSLLFYPKAKPPIDPATGKPVAELQERIDHLIKSLRIDDETVLIPTPVLTEFLILVEDDGPKYLSAMNNNRSFDIKDFDQRAAIELAAIDLKIIKSQGKGARRRGATPQET